MENVTLGLAILLAAGLLTAKLGQLLKLPSVTGYILAGLLLGPSGFNFISAATVGSRLDHFTQIALMLIAFGIGEEIEISKLRSSARSIGSIATMQILGAFFVVSGAIFFVAQFAGLNESWTIKDHIALAILLGAVGVASAPAAILHVMRELKASGPLTSTLMAVVAVDNGLCIMIFGLSISIAGQLVGDGTNSLTLALFHSLSEISFSLIIGIITGLLLDLFLPKLQRQGEMLTAGLALLLICGEICRYFHLSSLLAGMAAGFIIINRDTRDVRLFRALNAFDPPIYVLFFALAGTHLRLSAAVQAGWLGLIYFLARIIGKIGGAWIGAKIANADRHVQYYLGPALIPQAGVAIGLIFLIDVDEKLNIYSGLITPVVLTTVVLSELIGPLCARFAVEKAGEVAQSGPKREECGGMSDKSCDLWHQVAEGIRLVPWPWKKLIPPAGSSGFVTFGASNPHSVQALARIATLLAYHFKAVPMSIRVLRQGSPPLSEKDRERLFSPERQEVESLGYQMETELIKYNDVADALVSAVEYNDARAVVLGFPVEGTFQGFQHILETLARHVSCPVVVLRMYGVLHTERILVSMVDTDELYDLEPVIEALSLIGEHSITLLCLIPAGAVIAQVEKKKEKLRRWAREHTASMVKIEVVSTEARQETIVEEAKSHDLLVMTAARKSPLKKLFFGSLAETVARKCRKPLLIVYRPENEYNV